MGEVRGHTLGQARRGKTAGLSQEKTSAEKGHVFNEGLAGATGRGLKRKK
jgi:hypothetical protein